jgi:2-polyprenyl-6-methoxyphenol hydroxylase-like FAD-dependent oxidoreductase
VDVGVLVAGAGPVGLTLACELERQGVKHRMMDAAPARAAVSRAADLHARSLELWDHTGVAEVIAARGLPITGVPLFSGGREVARLDFGGIDSPFPAARHVPGDVRIVEADNRACFQVHHRVAKGFRSGRVLLAGDAAHTMTPVNGRA